MNPSVGFGLQGVQLQVGRDLTVRFVSRYEELHHDERRHLDRVVLVVNQPLDVRDQIAEDRRELVELLEGRRLHQHGEALEGLREHGVRVLGGQGLSECRVHHSQLISQDDGERHERRRRLLDELGLCEERFGPVEDQRSCLQRRHPTSLVRIADDAVQQADRRRRCIVGREQNVPEAEYVSLLDILSHHRQQTQCRQP